MPAVASTHSDKLSGKADHRASPPSSMGAESIPDAEELVNLCHLAEVELERLTGQAVASLEGLTQSIKAYANDISNYSPEITDKERKMIHE